MRRAGWVQGVSSVKGSGGLGFGMRGCGDRNHPGRGWIEGSPGPTRRARMGVPANPPGGGSIWEECDQNGVLKWRAAVRSLQQAGRGWSQRGDRRRWGWRGTWWGRGVRPAGDRRGVSRCILHFPGPAGWTRAGVLTMVLPGFNNSHYHTGHGPVPGRPGWLEGTPGRAPAGSAGVFRP